MSLPVRLLAGASRFVVALVVCAVVLPPTMAAVAVGVLMEAPLPGAELPTPREGIDSRPSVVVDRHGTEIAVFRDFDRSTPIRFEDIPQVVIDAVVAIEDARFFEHDGVDLEGIARAARVNLETGEVAQGGSTITQQVIKNLYFTDEVTVERKVREALLALELERRMTKEEILFRYLDSIYYGGGAYGIGAAAEVYFDKHVSELDTSEAALLAGVIQSPSRLAPRVDAEAADERRRLVLQAMVDEGYLTEDDFVREARRTVWVEGSGDRPSGPLTLVLAPPANGASDHPHFVSWVEQTLVEELGPDLVYRGGLRIETSIDPALQRSAERAVAERLEGTEYPVEMAAVVLDHTTGHVLAMVGGRDYDASQVNLAIGGSTGFQPGSSFKPLVLAAAFQQGAGPETVYPAPGTWTPPGCTDASCVIGNYDGADRGELTLRRATELSVNTVYAELVTDVGIPATVDLAGRLGLDLDRDVEYGPSLALGAAESSTLEMASAYGTFANHGSRVAPTGVLRVVDPEGYVLVDRRNQRGTEVISAAVADNVTDVLRGVVTDGTGGRASLGDRPVAGKTGTAQNYWAAWFVGYTPQLTTAVWMGHADGLASLRGINGVGQVTGGSHPAIAWADIMSAGHRDLPIEDFPEPAELVAVEEAAQFEAAPPQETTSGSRTARPSVAADCGGPCRIDGVADPVPVMPPISVTTTTIATPATEPEGGSSTTTRPSPSPDEEQDP